MPGIIGITSSGVDTTTTVNNLLADDISTGAAALSTPQLVESALDLDIAVERFTVTTGSGTQDFTISGFGTPKGAIFIATDNQSDALVEDQGTGTFMTFGVGFTDGTNDRLVIRQIEDNTTLVNVNCRGMDTACAGIHEYSSENAWDAMSFDQWVTDGVRLSKSAYGVSRSYLMTVILLKGSDMDMAVGDVKPDGTVSGLSFKPNVLFVTSTGTGKNFNAGSNRSGIGFAHDTGAGTNHACWNHAILGGTNPSSTNSEYTNSFMISRGTGHWVSTVNTWNSDGFALQVTDGPDGNEDIMYAALRLGGGVSMTVELTPTSTGNWSKTGLAFQPGFLMTLCGDVPTGELDVHQQGGAGLPIHISATDGTNTYAHCWGAEDNASPQVVWSQAAQKTSICRDDSASTLQYEASLVSFNSDGWTENFTTAPGTALYTIRLAVET